MSPSTDGSVYLAAAASIEKKEDCGCCAAIVNNGGRVGEFEAWFKPEGEDSGYYWMGPCSCSTEVNIPLRVLAMCFMAAMVEAGDAY